MKRFTIVLAVICAVAMLLCACDGPQTECEHTFGEWSQSKAATCTQKGEEQRVCSKCQKTETRETEMTAHVFGEWAESKAATCNKKGEEQRACSVCQAVETRETAMITAHTFGEWTETTPATCNQKGEEQRTCSVCQTVETRETEMTDHVFGEWTETKPATAAEDGEETRECGVCHATETRPISKLAEGAVVDFPYDGGLYTGVLVNDVPHDVNGKFVKDGMTFVGVFENGVATQGKLVYARQFGLTEYSGKFVAFNQIDTSVAGEGYYLFDNGCNYRGGIKANDESGESVVYQGQGTFKWFGTENVDTLVATFENGSPVSGTKTFPNGDKYEGEFVDFNFGGHGKYTFANGMYYEGDYVNGQRHGNGMFSWSTNGDYTTAWYYQGQFENDQPTVGTKYFVTRAFGTKEYTGRFLNLDAIDTSVAGEGYFLFDNGCNYRGGMVALDAHAENIVYQGQGTFKWFGTENVDTLVATFENGNPVSGTKLFACGDKYEGEFVGFNYGGHGKYTFSNGMYYEGDYVNGQRHGNGMFSWSTNGDYTTAWYYQGKFENDQPTVGTKHFVGRTSGVLQFTGKFLHLDAIDTSVAGSGIFSYGNGCWYQGGMTVSGDHADGCLFQGDGKFYWGLDENTWTVYEGNFTNSAITPGSTGTKTWNGRTSGVLIYVGAFDNLDNINTSVVGVAYVKDETHDGWYNVTVADGQAGAYTVVSEYVPE